MVLPSLAVPSRPPLPMSGDAASSRACACGTVCAPEPGELAVGLDMSKPHTRSHTVVQDSPQCTGRRSVNERRRLAMPLVNVKLIEGVFDAEQKQRIVRDLTEAMVEIEGENMRPVTWVIVEEVTSGEWVIGGNPLSTADGKALAAGAPVG